MRSSGYLCYGVFWSEQEGERVPATETHDDQQCRILGGASSRPSILQIHFRRANAVARATSALPHAARNAQTPVRLGRLIHRRWTAVGCCNGIISRPNPVRLEHGPRRRVCRAAANGSAAKGSREPSRCSEARVVCGGAGGARRRQGRSERKSLRDSATLTRGRVESRSANKSTGETGTTTTDGPHTHINIYTDAKKMPVCTRMRCIRYPLSLCSLQVGAYIIPDGARGLDRRISATREPTTLGWLPQEFVVVVGVSTSLARLFAPATPPFPLENSSPHPAEKSPGAARRTDSLSLGPGSSGETRRRRPQEAVAAAHPPLYSYFR